MPKTKENHSVFLHRMTKTYPNTFRADNSVLFCLICDTYVNAKQTFQVKQHLETSKHLASAERKKIGGSSSTQTLLTTLNDRNASEFSMDLATCFLEANIPLYKARNTSVVNFLEKHTKYAVPSESTLQNKCLPDACAV